MSKGLALLLVLIVSRIAAVIGFSNVHSASRAAVFTLQTSCRARRAASGNPRSVRRFAPNIAQHLGAKQETMTFSRDLTGTLFKYGVYGWHAAFDSGPVASNKVAVLLGGLTDGLMSLPYTPELCERLHADGWRVVQPLMQSSHQGYVCARHRFKIICWYSQSG